ncbi:MAG TPA: alpha/beta fold hydrolase [Roseiarcus sp.]|nr:alpha/beta fold hydrolase [Roseiarcus sp.]
MRAVDLDMIFIAGLNGSGPDHWQTRWRQRMPNARLVEQVDWDRPDRDAWVAAVVAACEGASRPVLLLAHSLGVVTLAHAAERLPTERVKGAFLVAPPSDEALAATGAGAFAPAPMKPLPFPSLLVASRNDPYGAFAAAEAKARDWGSRLHDAGQSGHINSESGHGPWPEGAMRLAGFVKGL